MNAYLAERHTPKVRPCARSQLTPRFGGRFLVTVQTPTRRHVLVAADEHLAKH